MTLFDLLYLLIELDIVEFTANVVAVAVANVGSVVSVDDVKGERSKDDKRGVDE